MRTPDIQGALGEAWKAPLDRVNEWVIDHPERVHQASRGDLFAEQWRDVWYVRSYEQQDLSLVKRWWAVVLRDLRGAPAEVPRFYAEAEWEVVIYGCGRGEPPVNGDGLFDWDEKPPLLVYQFHGLSDRQVLELGAGSERVTFAQYVVEAMLLGITKRDGQWAHHFSKLVNVIREDGFGEPARRPLEIAPRSGCLLELEDGSTVSLPVETV